MSDDTSGSDDGPPTSPKNQPIRGTSKAAFKRRMYQLMTERGWRQVDLARKSGLTRDAISGYWNERFLPNEDSARAPAKAFNIQPEELFPGTDFSEPIRSDGEFRIDGKVMRVRLDRTVPLATGMKIMQLITDDAAD